MYSSYYHVKHLSYSVCDTVIHASLHVYRAGCVYEEEDSEADAVWAVRGGVGDVTGPAVPTLVPTHGEGFTVFSGLAYKFCASVNKSLPSMSYPLMVRASCTLKSEFVRRLAACSLKSGFFGRG